MAKSRATASPGRLSRANIRTHPTFLKFWAKKWVRSACPTRIREPRQWVFVVGCYNSGTTMLRDMIAQHPETTVIPWEGVRFTDVLRRPEDLGWVRMWCRCEEYVKTPSMGDYAARRRLLRDWSPWIQPSKSLVEKSIANVTRMRWLDRNLARVSFVGITRNMWPVCEGIRRRAHARGQALASQRGRADYSIEECVQQWFRSREIMRQGASHVRRWHHVTYEQVVADPSRVMAGIDEFLDLSRHTRELTTRMGDNAASVSRLTRLDVQRGESEYSRLRILADSGYWFISDIG